MFEIGDDERKVLLCLIHAETPLTVVEDTNLAVNVVVDIMRQLHHYRYIKAIGNNNQVMGNFDVDKIRKTRFQLTAKGFDEISGNSKPISAYASLLICCNDLFELSTNLGGSRVIVYIRSRLTSINKYPCLNQ